jgi:hypothetical protein
LKGRTTVGECDERSIRQRASNQDDLMSETTGPEDCEREANNLQANPRGCTRIKNASESWLFLFLSFIDLLLCIVTTPAPPPGYPIDQAFAVIVMPIAVACLSRFT